MPLMTSWVESANTPDTDFPLNNLPYGVFDAGDGSMPRCGVAIGDAILDVTAMEDQGHLVADPSQDPVFDQGEWNSFMSLGPDIWQALPRNGIT